MSKSKTNTLPLWVRNLRTMMEQQNYNPRSLSLKAGLNATAARDMLEGRSRFPRYDTVCALASALNTTPAVLMNDEDMLKGSDKEQSDHDLDLLTEIIARLQESAQEYNRKLTPRIFADIAATIYHRIQTSEDRRKKITSLRPQIVNLLDYEMLRQRRGK